MLVEKTERLYRNLKDWVTLDASARHPTLWKENVVISSQLRSSEVT